MGSEHLPLRKVGIYRNLPTFGPSIKNLSAIICGASGISGFNALRALLSSPERWSTVYALSRSPLPAEALQLLSPDEVSRVKHVSCDLTRPASSIANSLREANVKADYVFFYSYLPPPSDKSDMDPDAAKELVEVNVPLLRNFLDALPLASIRPKRILLQTGGKNYGMHFGRVRTPLIESDPQPRHLAPNFYYPQEDALFEYCKLHPETAWNVIRPVAVIGASPSIGMNAFYPFAVYAVVQQQKGEPVYFGGDFGAWQYECAHSTARLTGYLSEWAVREDKCANQAFNAQDGSPLSWDRFFNELARWFGVEKGVVGPQEDDAKFNTLTMGGGENAPLGYGPPLTVRRTFTLSDWAADQRNRNGWEELVRQSNGRLRRSPWDGDLAKTMMGDYYGIFGSLSMNKVRRFGFNGHVDTLESIFEQYQEMEKLGFLPLMKVEAALPMI